MIERQLDAAADMDSAAESSADADIHRRWRRRRGWRLKVFRQGRIVGRRWDIGVNRIGDVHAPTHGNAPTDACADVGVGHTGGLQDGIHLRNRGKSQRRYPRRSQDRTHTFIAISFPSPLNLYGWWGLRAEVYSSALAMRPESAQPIALGELFSF